MYLTKLSLRNWRSYRNCTFSFPSPDRNKRKNVILVGAQNGVGKTSLLMGLYLGLFGREAMRLIEGFTDALDVGERGLSYQKLIEGILHRPAQNSEDPSCSVTLAFDVGGNAVTINRRWNFKTGGKARDLNSPDGEEVFIEANNRRKAFNSWQEANNRIEELLFPSNVMSCLFFDGEQAQKRVEAAGGRALFEAVKTLYGTGLLEQLSDSLRSFAAGERRTLTRDAGTIDDGELDRKRNELDSRRDQLAVLQSELSKARAKRVDAEQRRRTLEQDLFNLVGDSTTDVQEYASALAVLNAEKERLQAALVQQMGDVALPLAITKSYRRVADEIGREEVRERWLVLKDEATKKAELIVDDVLPAEGTPGVEPPLTAPQALILRGALERALERLWSPPPAGCDVDSRYPFLSAQDRASVIGLFSKINASAKESLKTTAADLHSVNGRLAEARQRVGRTQDLQPQLARLKGDLEQAHADHADASSEVTGLEVRERADQQYIVDLRAAIGQMEARSQVSHPILARIDVAERLRALADDAKEKLVPLCKEALEDRCTHHFRAMISGEYRGFRARFEAQNEPWLEGAGGQVVTVSTMSGAQKRAFGLAFTLAVADVAGTEAPIVIDTPVGNMDSRYRSRVLKHVADAAPGQVIILSHDEEVYGPYVDAIASKILQKSLVHFEEAGDGAGVSTVSEGSYF